MVEGKLRTITGMVLWVLSAVMSMGFFLAWAGVSWISLAVAGALSGALELTKVLSWRRGSWYRLLSVLLSMMTLLTVLGTTLTVIQHREASSLDARLQALGDRRDYLDAVHLRDTLESQLQGISGRLAHTPNDWPTVYGKLSAEAQQVRRELRDVSDSLATMEQAVQTNASEEGPSIFTTLANQIGAKTSQVELVILMVLAFLVEVSAFSLSGTITVASVAPRQVRIGRTEVKPTPNAQSGAVSPMDYLRVATDSPKAPILLGRGPCSRQLGITPAQARSLLQALIDQGLVVRQSKYFKAITP
jgi:hypothetical protein